MERKVSIKELIDIIGDEFDMEREFNKLLQAITYNMNIEFKTVIYEMNTVIFVFRNY